MTDLPAILVVACPADGCGRRSSYPEILEGHVLDEHGNSPNAAGWILEIRRAFGLVDEGDEAAVLEEARARHAAHLEAQAAAEPEAPVPGRPIPAMTYFVPGRIG